MIVPSATTNDEFYRYLGVLRLFTVFVALSGFITSTAPADEIKSDSSQTSHPPITFLEGKAFAGELGQLGKPGMAEDLLIFQDGMFISEKCQKKCGYTAGPYWMRLTEDGVKVRAETPCLKSDATIVWNGTVKGDEIEGTFTWTSRRWYWTIEKEFWFNGKLVESDVSLSD